MAIVLPLWGMIGIWTDKFGSVSYLHISSSGHDQCSKVSQYLGVLGLQRGIWILPSTVLFIHANGDGRAVATWVRLYGECS